MSIAVHSRGNCTDCIVRSRQKDQPLLKSNKGLYNVRHIKDPELIELERRVSPIQDPEQSVRVPPVRPESKTQR